MLVKLNAQGDTHRQDHHRSYASSPPPRPPTNRNGRRADIMNRRRAATAPDGRPRASPSGLLRAASRQLPHHTTRSLHVALLARSHPSHQACSSCQTPVLHSSCPTPCAHPTCPHAAPLLYHECQNPQRPRSVPVQYSPTAQGQRVRDGTRQSLFGSCQLTTTPTRSISCFLAAFRTTAAAATAARKLACSRLAVLSAYRLLGAQVGM